MVREGPADGELDRNEAAPPPDEPAREPALEPAPGPVEPQPERGAPVFVVAALQPEPATDAHLGEAVEDDAGPLFIVPAVQVPAEMAMRPVEPASRPEQAPEPEPEYEPELEPEPVPKRRRRIWRPGCFTILLLLVIALVAGGVYAYQTGLVTPRIVLEAAGFGAAEVELMNLRDDAVRVDLAAGPEDEAVPATFRLAPFEIRTYRAPRPAALYVTLTAADGTSLGTCALDLEYGDRLQIVALPDTTLIRDLHAPPATGSDLLLAQSSRCR